MLREQTVLFCVLVAIGSVRCSIYSDFDLFQRPIDSWNWPAQRNNVAIKDREELSPDFKDPTPSGSEQKPILEPKPHPPTTYSPLIPGGIVDVDAGGFQQPLNPFAVDFAVPGLNFNRKPGVFSFGSFFGTDSGQWWKGPNVCIEREESTDDDEADEDDDNADEKNGTEVLKNPLNLFSTSIRFSKCQETSNKYECITRINNHGVVKTFTVRYKCCYGFKRQEGTAGCSKQVDLKPLMDTLDDLDAKEFKTMIQNGNVADLLTNENYTLFAPTDAALNDYNENIVQMNTVEGQKRRRAIESSLSARDLALSHAVKGFIDLTELANEDVIYSDNRNSSIRINYYPTPQNYKRLTTVNCARVKRMNNLAENGIVHVMDGVVVMSTQTIRQIIADHPKLTSLKQVLDNTDIYTHMKADGHYTIFAATDEAFNKLDDGQKRKILSGGGCASSILKHHITAHTVCSAAIIGNATTHNVEGVTLNLERTLDDDVLFEGKAKIVESDIVATDGVIHLIDTLVMPDSALDVANILKTENLTKFDELIERAGLKDEFANLNNVTVFAPTNKAFEKPESKKLLEEIGEDTVKLQQFVKYHTVKGEVKSCDLDNNKKLSTYDNDNELRVNLYSTLPLFTNVVNRATINCARIGDFDEKACGSVVHEVNGLLVPPTKNLYELLQDDEKYSTVRELMKDTAVEKILQENNRSITFLAPTDETFAAVDEDFKKDLLQDKKRAEEVLKNHILSEVLCCSGVGPKAWGFNNVIPTMMDQHVEVGKVGSKVRINRATVTSCDHLATNGVLHNINKIMVPQRPVNTFAGSFFLFDL